MPDNQIAVSSTPSAKTNELYHLFHSTKKYNEKGEIIWFDEKLRNKLIQDNLLLVRFVANKMYKRIHKKTKEEVEDIIHEGQLGLFKAVVKFDPTMGNQFSTYAVFWIRQYISGYFKRNRKSVQGINIEQEELESKADDNSSNMEESIDSPSSRAAETLDLAQLSSKVAEVFNKLPLRTKYILLYRFGIIGEQDIKQKPIKVKSTGKKKQQ